MKRKSTRWILSIILAVMIATIGGCYGSFNLVRKVHKWNGTFGDKFVNEIGFLVLNIVPVYGVAAFVDAIVLNSIEFWTGKNPSSSSNDTIVPLDENNSLTLRGSDQSVLLTSKTDAGTVQYVFAKSADGTLVKNLAGKVLARCVMTDTGSMRIYDGSGTFVAECSASKILALAEASGTE
jgi:hypothetical protein